MSKIEGIPQEDNGQLLMKEILSPEEEKAEAHPKNPETKLKWADPNDGLGGFTAYGDITNTPEDRK